MLRGMRESWRWLRVAGFAGVSLLAMLSSLAGTPVGEEPTQGIVTTVFRPAVYRPATDDPLAPRLAGLGVPRWHHAGIRGQGMKVAVFDSGFRGYRDALGKHLPARVTARSFRRDGELEARDSQHGILCAEIVHSIAPDAEILLANWEPDSPESFARAVAWAKSQGARVATCSVIMPSWSDGAGGGPAHAALRPIVGDGRSPSDMIFAVSAGNLAERHWSGPLSPASDGMHQWSNDEAFNVITPWGTERVAVELYGSFTSWCRLQVFERDSGRMVQESDLRPEIADGRPWGQTAVRFEPSPRCQYTVAVRVLKQGASNDPCHLVILGGNLQTCNRANSIPFPGDGDAMVTLGCVDDQGRRLFYSSCGPNSARPKPDFVARVPFPSRFRDRPFSGTSAAAPQAAGLAALILSRDPRLTPDQVRESLRESALDLLTPGHDGETGHGLLRLP